MQQQMHVPKLTKVNKILISVYVGLFILSSLFKSNTGASLLSDLGLSIQGIEAGHYYQFITYPFIDHSFMTVLFNALILWFIGSELEVKWGSKFYGKFLAIATYSGGVAYALIFSQFMSGTEMPLYGLTGLNLALFVAYAIIYSERTLVFMFIFPMKAKYFCMLLAGIELYMSVFSAYSHGALSHLISMLVGFAFLKIKSLQARGVTLGAIKEQHHRNKMKQKLKLVKEDELPPDSPDPDKPKYWQ